MSMNDMYYKKGTTLDIMKSYRKRKQSDAYTDGHQDAMNNRPRKDSSKVWEQFSFFYDRGYSEGFHGTPNPYNTENT